MAYSELIKHFGVVRSYMRDFFVYGFRSRGEFTKKSLRSYDDERRRIDGWMGGYMGFHRDSSGKNVFMTLSGAAISHNPLYTAFKVKSFTRNDAALHFFLMDVLPDDRFLSLNDIIAAVDERLGASDMPDAATIRGKLREYSRLGLIESRPEGRESRYRKSKDCVDPAHWQDAINLFSEIDPIGVIGSFLLDRLPPAREIFAYKHHYILHALESEVLLAILKAMREKRKAVITVCSARREKPYEKLVTPMRVLISSQTGRRYLASFDDGAELRLNRLDSIQRVQAAQTDPRFDELSALERQAESHMWSQLPQPGKPLETVRMTVVVSPGEEIIIKRLKREKRRGTVEQIDAARWRFTAQVDDGKELLPWIRTFYGRIADIYFSNAETLERFERDMAAMYEMYGVK